jgi:uncharacterized protein YdeI (BOF family)
MPRILAIVSILGLAAGVALAQPAKRDQFERIPGPVVKIEEIRAGANYYERVTIQGEVLRSLGKNLFELEDSSGTMLVYIPWHLLDKNGTPGEHDVIRAVGNYMNKPLYEDVKGISVRDMRIVERFQE